VDEAGVPGLHISTWHALWMPKGTSKEIITRLNGAVDHLVEAQQDRRQPLVAAALSSSS
jgi:tripartite-type tricarboxylate transporter receptor subunit TctC